MYGTIGLWTDIYEDPQPSSGFAKIGYYIDDKFLAEKNDYYSKILWDTNQFLDGPHTIYAKVYDNAGNVGVSEIKNIAIKN